MDVTFEKKVKQALLAKEKRGSGGGRKRCRKGKSCGSSCIVRSKVCLVDVSQEIADNIGVVIRSILRNRPNEEERKSNIRAILSSEKVQAISKEEINKAIRSFADYIKSSPVADNKANRDTLLALRALRAKVSTAKPTTKPTEKTSTPKTSKVKNNKTPGSSRPIQKFDPDQTASRIKEEIKDLNNRINKLSGPEDDVTRNTLKGYVKTLSAQLAMVESGETPSISLHSIYNLQGFNARPEIVQTRADLEKSGRILKNSDGSPVILYRGVSRADFSDQFKGIGPQGMYHYVGLGVFGDGTYAASAPDPKRTRRPVGDRVAKDTAKKYAIYGTDFDKKVTAFALRSDAKVLEFKDMSEYHKWSDDVKIEANKRTGYFFSDPGVAAAALGIHAYRVPVNSDTDYWVILNRGAVIAALDPELSRRRTPPT